MCAIYEQPDEGKQNLLYNMSPTSPLFLTSTRLVFLLELEGVQTGKW
jgi:hypothetical protein